MNWVSPASQACPFIFNQVLQTKYTWSSPSKTPHVSVFDSERFDTIDRTAPFFSFFQNCYMRPPQKWFLINYGLLKCFIFAALVISTIKMLFIIYIKHLFNQERLSEIKNLFFKGILAKIGSSNHFSPLCIKGTELPALALNISIGCKSQVQNLLIRT